MYVLVRKKENVRNEFGCKKINNKSSLFMSTKKRVNAIIQVLSLSAVHLASFCFFSQQHLTGFRCGEGIDTVG